MLSQLSQRKTNTVCSHLYAESKKVRLIETGTRRVVVGVWGVWGEWGDVGQRVQTLRYKMNDLWGFNIQLDDYR